MKDFMDMSPSEKKETIEAIQSIINDDSLNPIFDPKEANVNAYDRWEKAKELAPMLEKAGWFEVVGIEDGARKNGNTMFLEWTSIDDVVATRETLIPFLSLFDEYIFDNGTWLCVCHVFR